MGPTVSELLTASIDPVRLKILVFGPQVKVVSADDRTRNLQNKRQEIRVALETAGHYVKYAEDLVDPTLTGPSANPLIQELVLMGEYDLIVNLVGSPGSNVEAAMIAMKPLLARKTALYLDRDHVEGLPGKACLLAETMGAHFQTYEYPTDLTDCHLLTHVTQRAATFQLMKYLL